MKHVREIGVSIIEALIGLAVLGIALAFIAPGFSSSLLINNRVEVRSQASIVARRTLENARIANVTTLPSSGQTPITIVNLGGRQFNVVTKYCAVIALCGSGSRHLRVEVEYANENVYKVDTVFTQLSSSGP